MTIFFWNPISLTDLTRLVLVLVITVLLVRTQRGKGTRARTPLPTLLLSSGFGFYGGHTVTSFLRAILRPDLQTWVEPPISVLSSIAILLLARVRSRDLVDPVLSRSCTASPPASRNVTR